MAETWKPLPGYDGYEVSDYGRVRSVDREVPSSRNGKPYIKVCRGKILNQHLTGKGYLKVDLYQQPRKVSHLVMLAFVGSRPPGMQVAHNDGNPLHNHLSNLRYATSSENQMDRVKHGTSNRGERNGMIKLMRRRLEMEAGLR